MGAKKSAAPIVIRRATAADAPEVAIVYVAVAIVIVVAMGAALMGASVNGQQPTRGSRRTTPWCPEVPASPVPPHFEPQYGNWAATRKRCQNSLVGDRGCGELCMAAENLWSMQKGGAFDKPNRVPPPTDKLQGPLHLPGGGNEYILPKRTAPTPSS